MNKPKNFKRASLGELCYLLAQREAEGGWNEAILKEIRNEISWREGKENDEKPT